MLQHRGAVLLTAGHSIAVQNFNQNIAVLVMLGLYALMLVAAVPVPWIIAGFGVFICGLMLLIMRRHAYNERHYQSGALLDERKAS